ncbi:uncharacterized protein LOC141674152 [Apium graveolens]|uniref:uncharacterized protein LOC141674152 n=1 Tax=Apium graveolens TaxID=4045 RepID=UPI003D792447
MKTILINESDTSKKIKIGSGLETNFRKDLVALLQGYSDIFAWTPRDMPGLDESIAMYSLDVNLERKPVKQKRRNFSPERQKAIDEEIEKLLKAGIICEVKYPEWLANIVMVKKANGKWRMCIDYTDLNNACPKDPYPLPNIDQLIDATSGHVMLSFMDAYSGYNQIKMDPKNILKTAFITHRAVYAYVMLPFRLTNAGTTYQRAMNKIFKDQIGRNQESYVKDMIAKSTSIPGHIGDLRECFDNLRKYSLRLNPEKIAIKAQALADFIIECNFPEEEPVPMSIDPGRNIDQDIGAWALKVDGSSTNERSGAGLILKSPEGFTIQTAISFGFSATNNQAEEENSEADTLSKLVQNSSYLDCSVYFEELQKPSIESKEVMEIDNSPNWMTPFINYLEKGELPEDKGKAQRLRAKAAKFFIEEGILYRQTFSSPILKCIGPGEAQYCLMEVHEGICGDHMSAKALAHKIIRQGYYWPTIHQDAIDFVKKCKECLLLSNVSRMSPVLPSSVLSPIPFAVWGIDIMGPFPRARGDLRSKGNENN